MWGQGQVVVVSGSGFHGAEVGIGCRGIRVGVRVLPLRSLGQKSGRYRNAGIRGKGSVAWNSVVGTGCCDVRIVVEGSVVRNSIPFQELSAWTVQEV